MAIVPEHTETIKQGFFIEAIQGPGHPSSYLDRFPDNVYNTSPDSVLYKLLYTLIGPTGVASLKKGYYEARLKFEEMGLQFNELEKFYANPMGFGRIAAEVYSEDPAGLLNNDIWARVKLQDQAYRNRVLDFLHGARLGGTPEGMRYVAKSAFGHDVDIVEGYQYLFDQNSDQIIGIQSLISPNHNGTYSTEKFAVIPRPEVSGTVVQTIRFNPAPQAGSFIISYQGESTTIYVVDPITGDPCTYETIQTALRTFKSIKDNVIVSGSLEDKITIQFVGALSNQKDVSIFTVDSSNAVAIYGYESPKPCAAIVETNSGVIPANQESSFVSPESQHMFQIAVDQVRPVTAYPVVLSGRSEWNQIIFDQNYPKPVASSEYTKVVRYVTGDTEVPWPPVDSIHWIESGVEVEAPSASGDYKESYQDFHEINNIYSFSPAALNDANYANDVTVLKKYNTAHVGSFNPDLTNAIPFLTAFDNPTYDQTIFKANLAVADHTKPKNSTSVDSYTETGLVDGIYPNDYFKLPNVTNKALNNLFWASNLSADGSEYLEIDLGETKAVNFIVLEALKLPISITIEYDVIDFDGCRSYVEVTPELMPGSDIPYPFNTDIFYSKSDTSSWEYLTYNFRDKNQEMIYTRYLRIRFDRRTTSSIISGKFLVDARNNPLPWPVCIRNLRIGRNV